VEQPWKHVAPHPRALGSGRLDAARGDRAAMVRPAEKIVAADLASVVVKAGVDPTLDGRALQDALRRAIATSRGYCSWDVDHASWVVTLHSPEEHDFYGKTLEEALAWCLVWLMAPELGVGPYFV